MKRFKIPLWALLIFALPAMADPVELGLIGLPDGFRIEVYAGGVNGARQMALGDRGTLFVGSRGGIVYAITDADGDQHADRVQEVVSGLNQGSGVEFRNGSLFVSDMEKILRYDDIESRLDFPPRAVVVTDALDASRRHGRKYLRFGPDGRLYIPIGADCNVCEVDGFGEIVALDLASNALEVFAKGIRNSVGLAFHPASGDLWFTDNGRDHMGDELPACELNRAPEAGLHFGFPYCHQGDVQDPEFTGRSCSEFIAPVARLGPHVAPLGLAFYTGDMFPQRYKNQLFVAEHGSWNRSRKIGYRVKLVELDDTGKVVAQSVFARGWLQGEQNWGRPADTLVMPDGALLVSDDQAGVIYRISYVQPGA